MGVTGPKERATFSLSADVKGRLEEAVPKSERSRFVEDAITRALREDARKAFLKFLDELPRSSGGENSTDILRRIRLQADGRPLDTLEGSGE